MTLTADALATSSLPVLSALLCLVVALPWWADDPARR